MFFTEDDEVVQDLCASPPYPSLGERIQIRTSRRNWPELDVVGFQNCTELFGELGIAIADNMRRPVSPPRRIPIHLTDDCTSTSSSKFMPVRFRGYTPNVCMVESPANGCFATIAVTRPDRDMTLYVFQSCEASSQALFREYGYFNLGHVQPTGVFRCVMPRDPLQKWCGSFWPEGFDQRLRVVGVEVIEGNVDTTGLGITIQEIAHEPGTWLNMFQKQWARYLPRTRSFRGKSAREDSTLKRKSSGQIKSDGTKRRNSRRPESQRLRGQSCRKRSTQRDGRCPIPIRCAWLRVCAGWKPERSSPRRCDRS